MAGSRTREQEKRFAARIADPLRQWLSPMDIESYGRWYQFSRARDLMLNTTDTKHAPWYIVRSDDKRRARLNCISHILSSTSWKQVRRSKVTLSKCSSKDRYDDQATLVLFERGGKMTALSIVVWFNRVYRELGLDGCSSHSGRKTFITRAARLVHKAGGSLRDVQIWLDTVRSRQRRDTSTAIATLSGGWYL